MECLLALDSDGETDDMVLDLLAADEEDERSQLRTRKARGPFNFDSKSDTWAIEHCRYVVEVATTKLPDSATCD